MSHKAVSPLNLVLIGRTGNGKSATGNTILGSRAFQSKTSCSGVTKHSVMGTLRKDGKVINVIDTPGVFDASAGSEYVAREIVKCMDLVKEGIHAVVLVFSVRTRFSEEEEATIRILQNLFGTKIVDFVIVLFTGGDDLEENDETLEDYLGRESPVGLRDIIAACKNRYLLFNNKTKDKTEKAEQVEKLLGMVNEVVRLNGGKGYTHGLIADLKYEAKLQEVRTKLEQQLEHERKARIEAEERAEEIQNRSNSEIGRLQGSLRRLSNPFSLIFGSDRCVIS